MTRHGKNATSSAVYSYGERTKDARQSGYGSLVERLGADSIKPFDCCSLTLQPCKEPLISPQGFIFDREAILNYILDQKNAYKRKLKIWEQQNRIEQEKFELASKKTEDAAKEKFIAREAMPAYSGQTPKHNGEPSKPVVGGQKRPAPADAEDQQPPSAKSGRYYGVKEDTSSVSNMAGEKAKQWRSFWMPVLHPTAEPTKFEKPVDRILCPISGAPLKFKELLPVKFTPIDPELDFKKLVAQKVRYLCPITRDPLTDTSRCAYLKTSQCVVSMDCVEKILRRDAPNMMDPLCGKPLAESDIIELSRGGTGFAATNELKAKLIRPQLELQ